MDTLQKRLLAAVTGCPLGSNDYIVRPLAGLAFERLAPGIYVRSSHCFAVDGRSRINYACHDRLFSWTVLQNRIKKARKI